MYNNVKLILTMILPSRAAADLALTTPTSMLKIPGSTLLVTLVEGNAPRLKRIVILPRVEEDGLLSSVDKWKC